MNIMKRRIMYFALLLLFVLLSGCRDGEGVRSKKYELRQLATKNSTSVNSSAWFFIAAGSASSSTEEEFMVSVFVKLDTSYCFMKINSNNLRIMIKDGVEKPYLLTKYSGTRILYEDEYNRLIKTDSDSWCSCVTYTIVCSESMLPERLLPIDITKN